MYKYHLVGTLEGATINLGGHKFVDGVFTFGPNEEGVTPSPEDAVLKGNYLAKSFQAFQEGPALDAARERFGKGEPQADELKVPEREQQQQQEDADRQVAGRERKGAVRTALTKLDAANDDHWTSGGLPSVEAVRELSGNKDVSRQDIAQLAPNLTREEAKKLAAENTDPLD